jgi:hypothetical protein
MRKWKVYGLGAVLLCTSLVLAAVRPAKETSPVKESGTSTVVPQNAKSSQERGQPAELKAGGAPATHGVALPAEKKPAEVRAAAPEKALTDKELQAMKAEDLALQAGSQLATEQPMAVQGDRACSDCLTPNVALGDLPTAVWGGDTGLVNVGTEGKWYASFNGVAGAKYHFDLCPAAPGTVANGNFDADIKVVDATCTILTGVDGSCTGGGNNYLPNDFQWTCATTGTYYVVVAPYRSYNQHNCIGVATNTFDMQYYAELPTPPCPLTCPPTALIEPEPCDQHIYDGCNITPNAFVDINLGETYCGTAYTYSTGSRDTDWYRLTLTSPTEVTWTVASQFPSAIFILSGACGALTTEAAAYDGECNPVSAVKCLPAGTYYLFVSVGNSAGGIFTGYPCSLGKNAYVASVTGVPCEVPYCTPCYTNQTDDWITNVTFNTINNTTGVEPGGCKYGDYTSLSTDVQIGTTYQLSVTFSSGTYTEHVWAWFDWNQDRVYAASEGYDLGQGASATLTKNITIPAGALLGPTRMHVIEKYNSDPTACAGGTYGETEDYTVNVLPAPPTGACCLGTTCQDGGLSQAACEALGGVYQGDGSVCTPNPCSGACCLPSGSCTDGSSADCTAAGGIYQGNGTACATVVCATPGDNCSSPYPVVLSPGFASLTVANQYTCGRGNDYADTCLGSYDGGEDMIFQITVTAPIQIIITLDPKGTTWPGFALSDACPPAASGCLIVKTQSGGTPMASACTYIPAGTYYLMVDTWPSPDCIPLFDVTFAECTLPLGSCCYLPYPSCVDGITQNDCTTLYSGSWTEGLTCANTTCPSPVADNCADALPITEGHPAVVGNNCAATTDGSASCQTNSGMDVWYTYSPSFSGTVTVEFDTEGTSPAWDTVLSIYDACGGTELACDDDGGSGTLSKLTLAVTQGTTYWIRLAGYNNACGTFKLNVWIPSGACCFADFSCQVLTPEACTAGGGMYKGDATVCTPTLCVPQPGDNCLLPLVIPTLPAGLPYTDTAQYTCGRVDDYNATCLGSYDGGEDIIYQVSVTEPICVQITATGVGSSNNWIGLAITDVCPPAATCIAAVASGSGLVATIPGVVLLPGTYFIMVDTYPSPTCLTDFNLEITTSTTCPQGACCGAGGTLYCQTMFEAACVAAGGSFVGVGSVCTGQDCLGYGEDDTCSIFDGLGTDCNNNGHPDACDITAGTSQDVDLNGVPDECQLDCNANGIVDTCELPGGCATGNCGTVFPGACGTALDCNNNGLIDWCELNGGGGGGHTYAVDDGTAENGIGLTNGGNVIWLNHFVAVQNATNISSVSVAYNNVADGTPVTILIWNDPTNDGDPTDAQVIASAASVVANAGTDTFNVVNFNPGVNVGNPGAHFFVGVQITHVAGEYPAAIDETASQQQSWIAGTTTGTVDPNNMGAAAIPVQLIDDAGLPGNWLVRAEAGLGGSDCNGNGIPDDCDIADGTSVDCNANGIPDECELATKDCNGNGIPDDCDIAAGAPDCNANGIPDSCELADGSAQDCNGNGIPDSCDIASGAALDCNANGIPDSCDIASGLSQDCQPDAIPDECQLNCGKDKAIIVTEGFEAGVVPPAGWGAQIQNASYTWKLMAPTGTPHGGTYAADVEYDPALSPQDEWLLTPSMILYGNVTLTGWSMGSVYWGITPYDNYDLEAWAVVGPTAGDGDDILLGQLDTETWVTNWTWAQFTYNFTAPTAPFRIGFRYVGTDGAQAGLDDVQVDGAAGAPACDCNTNGIPDECDILIAHGGFCDPAVNPDCSTDFNGNGKPDECDPLCGDLNGDSAVTVADWYLFWDAYRACTGDPRYLATADMDGDGCITLVDYSQWLACYKMANHGKEFKAPTTPTTRLPARGTRPAVDR